MLLEIRDLTIAIQTAQKRIDVVDRMSLSIPRGKVVALVGESGCGKSITALSILRLLPKPAMSVTSGEMNWNGNSISTATVKERGWPPEGAQTATKPVIPDLPHEPTVDLLQIPDREMRAMRGCDIAMVFQEPMTALNPVFSVGEQIVEVLMLHRAMSKKEAWSEAAVLLNQVGIADAHRRVRDYPHQFSGGMRQRVLIAMAIACRPQLLIADEPTTALDVTVQAQILDLLRDLQSQTGLSILLITHDLGVVAQMADYVYVMYAGRIVEHAPTANLFEHPMHPYTEGLFRCTPSLDGPGRTVEAIAGTVPDPARFPTGCRFHPRCEISRRLAVAGDRIAVDLDDGRPALRRCVEEFDAEPSGIPRLREAAPQHFVACWESS